MMQDILRKIAIEIAEREERELNHINNKNGIFFMPELAYCYMLGKNISITKEFKDWEWNREVKIPGYGISDLFFTKGNEKLVVEVKLRGTINSYLKDINRLKQLGQSYRKFFLLLTDVFENKQNDPRVLSIKKQTDLKLVSNFRIFQTNYSWYKKDTFCLIGLWEITN